MSVILCISQAQFYVHPVLIVQAMVLSLLVRQVDFDHLLGQQVYRIAKFAKRELSLEKVASSAICALQEHFL